MRDVLDEWVNWRGRIVQRYHYTYGSPEIDPIEYLVVGGNAARYIRRHAGPIKDKSDYLVLVPITRDTDEDSYLLEKRENIVKQ